jgi:hypothetical protein
MAVVDIVGNTGVGDYYRINVSVCAGNASESVKISISAGISDKF